MARLICFFYVFDKIQIKGFLVLSRLLFMNIFFFDYITMLLTNFDNKYILNMVFEFFTTKNFFFLNVQVYYNPSVC